MMQTIRDNSHALIVAMVLIGAGIAGVVVSFLYGDWE
jgi:hypothetical protein